MSSDYFVRPFEVHVWLAIFVSIVIFGSILLAIANMIDKSDRRSLVDDIFIGFESISNQSGNDNVEKISCRIICISLRAASLFVLGSLGAVITSFLTVEIPQVPFTNLEEFSANGQYRVVTNDAFVRDFFVRWFLYMKVYVKNLKFPFVLFRWIRMKKFITNLLYLSMMIY